MQSAIYTSFDHIGRCLDGVIMLACGIAVLVAVPRQIRRQIASGKLDEAKGKSRMRLVWPVGCLAIGYGILKIFAGF
ncbi:MAG TPA: hypothetical protein VH280_11340 [Verrucomicrobiae bacterium]|jgi:hypothetical protein|nr:hypothetical protein [Verrucomicrobiae bacterium]